VKTEDRSASSLVLSLGKALNGIAYIFDSGRGNLANKQAKLYIDLYCLFLRLKV